VKLNLPFDAFVFPLKRILLLRSKFIDKPPSFARVFTVDALSYTTGNTVPSKLLMSDPLRSTIWPEIVIIERALRLSVLLVTETWLTESVTILPCQG